MAASEKREELLAELLRQGGLTARYLTTGAAGLGAAFANPIAYLANQGLEAAGSDYRFPEQYAATQDLLTDLGFPEPEGALEEGVGFAAELGVPDPSDSARIIAQISHLIDPQALDIGVQAILGPILRKQVDEGNIEIPEESQWIESIPTYEFELDDLYQKRLARGEEMGSDPLVKSRFIGQGYRHPAETIDLYHGSKSEWETPDFKDFADPANNATHKGASTMFGGHMGPYEMAETFTGMKGSDRIVPDGHVSPMVIDRSQYKPVDQTLSFDPDDEWMAGSPISFPHRGWKFDDDAVANEIFTLAMKSDPHVLGMLMNKESMWRANGELIDGYEAARRVFKGYPVETYGGKPVTMDNVDKLVKKYVDQGSEQVMVVNAARKALREQGFEGLEYVNTVVNEWKGTNDARAYIGIPRSAGGEGYRFRLQPDDFDPTQHAGSLPKALDDTIGEAYEIDPTKPEEWDKVLNQLYKDMGIQPIRD